MTVSYNVDPPSTGTSAGNPPKAPVGYLAHMGVRRAFAVCAAAMVVLSACSEPDEAAGPPVATPTAVVTPSRVTTPGDPGQSGTSPGTTSSSPTATTKPGRASSAAAEIPAAARSHDAAGAEAYVRFYLAQVNKAWFTPSPEALSALSLPACKPCNNFVGTAETLKQSGRRYAGRAITLGVSAQLPESTQDVVDISGPLVQEAQDILGVDGTKQQSVKRSVRGGVLIVAWSTEGWKMRNIRFEAIG